MKRRKKIRQHISRIDKRIADYAKYLLGKYIMAERYKQEIASLHERKRQAEDWNTESFLGTEICEKYKDFNKFKLHLKEIELEQRKLKKKRKELNKQLNDMFTEKEKDEEKMVTIPLSVFERLCRCRTYFINWGDGAVSCKRCGSLNPEGYICAVCNWDNTFEPLEEEKIKINYLSND